MHITLRCDNRTAQPETSKKEIVMRHGTRLDWWLIGLVVPLLLLGASGAAPEKEVQDGVDLYFRDSSLEALAVQELAKYRETDPGDSKRFKRSFPDAPPQIPHTVEDMLPITADDNECLECHHPDNTMGEEDLPVPKTHFQRAVMGKGKKGEPMVYVVKGYEEAKDVVGSRYNCTMCHTPQAENARVISNTFKRIKGKPTQ
jgi:cytochrome c-type protein NapB